MKTLETLFLAQLADIYDAEHRLTKALPKLAAVAANAELRRAFHGHLNETQGHVAKLRQVFATADRAPKARRCEAIVGLLKESDEIVASNQGAPTLDAALICAAQKVEHYEIATYGCLREWADALGNHTAVQLLGEILEEEKSADDKLTDLACAICNPEAQDGSNGIEINTLSARRRRRRRNVVRRPA
jgi:ferritin-like metal-binding protein YciE